MRPIGADSAPSLGQALTHSRQPMHSGEVTFFECATSMFIGQAALHRPQPTQAPSSRSTALGLSFESRAYQAPAGQRYLQKPRPRKKAKARMAAKKATAKGRRDAREARP